MDINNSIKQLLHYWNSLSRKALQMHVQWCAFDEKNNIKKKDKIFYFIVYLLLLYRPYEVTCICI